MIYTTEIVKDKFWIVEDAGVKVGTIRKCSSDDFELNIRSVDILGMHDTSTAEHVSMSALTSRFGEKILEARETPKKIVEEKGIGSHDGLNISLAEIDGYPSKHAVYNIETIEKNGRQIPTYTKSETSKVRYAAGFYGVRYPTDWRWFYAGKLETLNTYDFIGPFKTKSEMATETLLQNRRDGL